MNTSKEFRSFQELAKSRPECLKTFQARHNYYAIFQQRIILDRCKADNSANSGFAGRISQQESILASRIFDKWKSRELWQNVCWNNYAWKNGEVVNLDQQDLLIICRRIAKILCRRKLGLETRQYRRRIRTELVCDMEGMGS